MLRLDAEPASVATVRRWLADLLARWKLHGLTERVTLCASELTTNAVLHARDAFVVTVRPAGGGVRIDVLDHRPELLPVMTPAQGTAHDITALGSSGRGLCIVASIASRWGVLTTADTKVVWAEITTATPDEPIQPEVAPSERRSGTEPTLTLEYLSLPVRTAVASGIHVDDVVRDLQLLGDSPDIPVPERARFVELLEASAALRFAGRVEALQQAGAGATRFDLTVKTTADEVRALDEFSGLLVRLGSRVHVLAPGPQVHGFREWLGAETARQLAGSPPQACPLG